MYVCAYVTEEFPKGLRSHVKDFKIITKGFFKVLIILNTNLIRNKANKAIRSPVNYLRNRLI